MFNKAKKVSRDNIAILLQSIAKLATIQKQTNLMNKLYKIRADLIAQTIHSHNWKKIDAEIDFLIRELQKGRYIEQQYTNVVNAYCEQIESLIEYRGTNDIIEINLQYRNAFTKKRDDALSIDKKTEETKKNKDKAEQLQLMLKTTLDEARQILYDRENLITKAAELDIGDIEELHYAQQIEQCERRYNRMQLTIKDLVDSIDVTEIEIASIKDAYILNMLKNYSGSSDKIKTNLIDNAVLQKEISEANTDVIEFAKVVDKDDIIQSHSAGMAAINKRRAEKINLLDRGITELKNDELSKI
ncbi:MAG: hypothetical protein LBM93_04920 [Oscillospiraceae bacterium]|jgi:hypothetical protein|nr:hypothetical protein [Oscillospiraceae bacterium]